MGTNDRTENHKAQIDHETGKHNHTQGHAGGDQGQHGQLGRSGLDREGHQQGLPNRQTCLNHGHTGHRPPGKQAGHGLRADAHPVPECSTFALGCLSEGRIHED